MFSTPCLQYKAYTAHIAIAIPWLSDPARQQPLRWRKHDYIIVGMFPGYLTIFQNISLDKELELR